MRMRSPSRTARCGLACSPFTSTLPPSQARFASDRVLNRQATSSQTSRRRIWLNGSVTRSDEDFDLALRLQRVDEGRGLIVTVLVLQELLNLRPYFLEGHGAARFLFDH